MNRRLCTLAAIFGAGSESTMFGQNKPGQQTGFGSFGAPASTSASGSFGFAAGASNSGSAAGFSFGTTPSQPSTTSAASTTQTQGLSGFAFGNVTSKPSIFGTVSGNSTTSTGSTISLGQTPQTVGFGNATAPAAAKPLASGFAFNLQSSSKSSTTSATTSSLPAFGSIASSSTAPAFASLTTATANKTTASTGFSFGTLPTTASTQASTLTLGSTLSGTQKTTATTGFTFGQATPASTQGITQPALNLGVTSKPASTLSTTLGSFGAKTATAVQPLQAATTFTTKGATALQPATSTITTSGTTEKPLTYKQLEENINKWVHELEEQESVFLNQAKQINVWDRLLIENGEQITQLNDEIQRLKADQSRLDRELDFILSQQQELEEALTPIEQHIKAQQSIPYMQHTDLEREKTYKMAENIDSQLKRMMQDMKDIISHINTSNTNLKENDDPMTQIAKILNSHMDSLQWVDQNAVLLQRKVEDVSKQLESRRREHERSLRSTFN